ncbi:MAG: 3-dehydroquinate synthase [Leptospiraceae bacterium]|nr:3-dehydroquinate synthase [Leptospiraceae bacterium]
MFLSEERVQFPGTNYYVKLYRDYSGLASELNTYAKASRYIILTEKKIAGLYGKEVSLQLDTLKIPYEFIYIKGGEKNKHIDRLKEVYNSLIKKRIDRKAVILALGGGVVGDFAGFVASTFLRGIRFVQLPTTLLACVDSSVGGKVAVNVDSGKNMVGAFHQPVLVYAALHTLYTLPLKEWRCGLAEVMKHSLLSDRSFFERVLPFRLSELSQHSVLIQYFITRSVQFKASVVAEDEKETGRRAILNLGHTTGHAIESYTSYKKYSHGEAVAIGLITALLLSGEMYSFPENDLHKVLEFMRNSDFPTYSKIQASKLTEHMLHDKKTDAEGIKFVLLKSVGEVEFGVPIRKDQIVSAWKKQKKV